jgi:serine/threonine protein kinase
MAATKNARDIFLEALDRAQADRAAYLDEACGGDGALRQRVEALIRANDDPGAFLSEAKPGGASDAVPLPPAEAADGTGAHVPNRLPETEEYGDPTARVGSVVAGKYKLIEEIGEGGMGSVYMAQQTEPVKRAVAVKVIKAGMDSKAVLARFEAERQALAMMDHPNIARVLDAGTTDGGRPFFVMELVKGRPITQHCDERKLTPRQRLELFVPVCQAIQHAHQKGIIHRDIKPSNVLVAMYDDKPVPKVIDFGVAKAAGPSLSDKTLMTAFGAVVGTPEYMSPEQASLSNRDIDTRSDVYSLGVLLYELLTGSTPLDRKSLGKAALLEILRIVREVEAPKPSVKLSTIDTLPNVAANRGTEPAKLSKLMKGELDWVVLKALEKDRTRRYDTANGLARDIQRYLADEVVEARPPSTPYRLKKFVRKHRGQVLAASLVLLALLGGLGAVVTVQALANEKIQAQNNELVRANDAIKKEITLKEEQRQLAKTRLSHSLEALGLFATDFRLFCEDALVPGANKTMLYERLIMQLERQVVDAPSEASADASEDTLRNKVWMYQTIAIVYLDTQQLGKAKETIAKGLKGADQWLELKPGDPYARSYRAAMLSLKADLESKQDLAGAKALYLETLKLRRELAGNPAVDQFTPGRSLMQLADTLDRLHLYEESLQLREQVCKVQIEKGVDADKLFESLDFWAWTCWKAYVGTDDAAKKKALLEKADELSRRALTTRPGARRTLERWYGITRELGDREYNLAKLAEKKNSTQVKQHADAAQKYYQELASISRQLAISPDLMYSQSNYGRSFYALGIMQKNLGNHAEARASLETSRHIREQLLRDFANHPNRVHLQIDLLFSLVALGEHAQAVKEADQIQSAPLFAASPGAQSILYRLTCIYSLSVAAVEDARRPNPLTDADKKLQAVYRDKALTALEQSHALGNRDFYMTRFDADLISIRDDPRYGKVLELEKKK